MARNDGNTIAASVIGVLTCPTRHNHGPVKLNLRYRLDRPLEVALDFIVDEHTYHHVVARDLICDAYGGHAADYNHIFGEDGFITFKVRRDYSWQVVVRVHGLTPDGVPGYGEIITPRTPVVEFLDRTLRAVPRGAEQVTHEVERAINTILGGAP